MNSMAGTASDHSAEAPFSIDLNAFRDAQLTSTPFSFAIVPGFVNEAAHQDISADFPAIAHAGSFPLSTLKYGAAFQTFMDEIQSPAMSAVVSEKFGIDLSSAPTMVTVRGMSRDADGKIHSDSRTKLITALIYMNDSWESPTGRLRLLSSPDSLEDVVAEVPPERGTMLIFKNVPHAWHGFESFSGPRRVIQLNWVSDNRVVEREQKRHRRSAFFKRLFGGSS
jgi:SM-20-related protein